MNYENIDAKTEALMTEAAKAVARARHRTLAPDVATALAVVHVIGEEMVKLRKRLVSLERRCEEQNLTIETLQRMFNEMDDQKNER